VAESVAQESLQQVTCDVCSGVGAEFVNGVAGPCRWCDATGRVVDPCADCADRSQWEALNTLAQERLERIQELETDISYCTGFDGQCLPLREMAEQCAEAQRQLDEIDGRE